jgi:hypothetical protein
MKLRRTMPSPTASVAALLLLIGSLSLQTLSVCAEKDSNPYAWGDNPNKRFKMYWNDARNVLQDLDQFQSLYVKYHGCVWSECSVDSFDDDGETRDGDEYWYQDRTQPFCANAAYSLYGQLKNHWGGFNSCTKKTYINSFFTYGGADTLLSVLDISTSTIFDDENGDDDGNTSKNSNAVCYEIEDENSNYNNRRELDSQDDNNYDQSMSSTMGCSAEGKFSVALFEGDTCDGNKFLETSDELSKYNRGANGINCKQIWNLRKDGKTLNSNNRRGLENQNDDNGSYYQPASSAEALLMNSWACDVQIYPDGCPDPYSLKEKYDAVLTAVSNGQSPNKAIRNARLKTPTRFVSTIMLLAGLVLLGGAYFIQNKKKGVFTAIHDDINELLCVKGPMTVKYVWSGFRKVLRNCLRGQRRKRKHSKKKKHRRRSKREKPVQAAQEIEDDPNCYIAESSRAEDTDVVDVVL